MSFNIVRGVDIRMKYRITRASFHFAFRNNTVLTTNICIILIRYKTRRIFSKLSIADEKFCLTKRIVLLCGFDEKIALVT